MSNVLNIINSNVEYAIKATENSYKAKVFVVTNGKFIESFNKTKRGAESYIKKNTFSYYDDYSHEMIQAGSNLEIVEICALDIVDYFNTKEIWFETIYSKWRLRQTNNYTLEQAKELGCSPEVIAFIENVLSNMDANSFPSREMVGLKDASEVIEEATPETIETVVNETNESIQTDITYKLNDEKNGIEIYFTNKPSEEVRDNLKAHGFRWSKFNKCWYAKQSNETISLAKNLAGGNVSNEVENVEQFEIEIPEFVDVTTFKISEDTEKRLIDNSLFGDMRKVGYETRSLQSTLSQLLEETKQVIEMTDNNYYKKKLIDGFNSFCERYTRELTSYLYNKSINPSWAVTGRGNINVDRYNKKQDAIFNKMGKVVEMLEKQRSYLDKYKNKFKSEEATKLKASIKYNVENNGYTVEFKTEKRSFTYYGYTYNTRAYISPNYFIMKMAGCFRIFENGTNKEVHSLKTTEKLDDAKAYVMYLESQLINKAV